MIIYEFSMHLIYVLFLSGKGMEMAKLHMLFRTHVFGNKRSQRV